MARPVKLCIKLSGNSNTGDFSLTSTFKGVIAFSICVIDTTNLVIDLCFILQGQLPHPLHWSKLHLQLGTVNSNDRARIL